MNTGRFLIIAAAALTLGTAGAFSGDAVAQGQGKGQAKGGGPAAPPGQAKGQSQRGYEDARGKGSQPTAAQEKGRGRETAPGQQAGPGTAARGPAAAAAPGQARSPASPRVRFVREIRASDVPASVRPMLTGNRRSQTIAAGALARAHVRGIDDVRLVPAGDRVSLVNDRGTVLLLLDEDRARNLGAWDVNPFEMPPNAGAPAFCRSGAGHPVWGRQWCIDKGFGLGTFQDVRWGRTRTLGDIIFGRTAEPGRLTTESLLSLLGATAFNRLALHAVTLGYAEPLVGTWVVDRNEPQVLLVNAGPAPVAEFVDTNRDGRPDLMFVALRPW